MSVKVLVASGTAKGNVDFAVQACLPQALYRVHLLPGEFLEELVDV